MPATDEVIRVSDQSFSDDLWNPMSTGREALDMLMSSSGKGIMPGTCMLVIGDPGVGKSTITMEMLSNMMKNGRDVLFVSAEMSQIDIRAMSRRFPVYGEIPTWLPDFRTENPMQKFEEIVDEGYDFVVLDSLAQFQELVSMKTSLTKNETLARFFSTVKNCMEGVETEDDGIKHTSFGLIQQVTKDGKMAGKKYIEHTVTSLLEIRHAEGDERYIQFGKNRRGGNTAKLFFEIGEDELYFDKRRLERHMSAREIGEEERDRQREEQRELDSIADAVEEDDFDDVDGLLNGSASVSESEGYRFERNHVLEIESVSDDELDALVDEEVVAQYWGGTDNVIKRTREELIEDGHWPADASRYYFEKFLARHDIADWDESDVN